MTPNSAQAPADLAESLGRVQEERGKVIRTMQGEDGEYVPAAVQDPAGAYFALMPR
jgi:predicted enzyme related to lactoylglutathione lyase